MKGKMSLFDKTEMKETLEAIETNIQIAMDVQYDTWKNTVTIFRQLADYLKDRNKLSPKQCQIIRNGCQRNNLPVPDVIDELAREADDFTDNYLSKPTPDDPEFEALTKAFNTPLVPQDKPLTKEEITDAIVDAFDEIVKRITKGK